MHTGLMALDLTRVQVPVLVFTRANDDVVDPPCSDVVAAALSGPVERLLLPNGGHVASLDADRDVLGHAIVGFVAALDRAD
ncbi:MAG: esterase, partial [Actinomycetes bacterium]